MATRALPLVILGEREDPWRKREQRDPAPHPFIHEADHDGLRGIGCRRCKRRICRWKSGTTEIVCKGCGTLNVVTDGS